MHVSASDPVAKFLRMSQQLRVKHFRINSLPLVDVDIHILLWMDGTFLYSTGPCTVKAQLLVQKRAAES